MISLRPLFVSFYTPDYAECAARLKVSLRAHDLDFEVDPAPDTGKWVYNCAKKPSFIWDKMTKNPGRPVVWVDADAVVLKPPVILTNGVMGALVDVAVCRYQWKHGRTETLSGTLYFSVGIRALKVVDRWIQQQNLNPDRWDQVSLAEALKEVPEAHVFPLPVEYCYIFDFHRDENPGLKPVIEHHQHSRITRPRKS